MTLAMSIAALPECDHRHHLAHAEASTSEPGMVMPVGFATSRAIGFTVGKPAPAKYWLPEYPVGEAARPARPTPTGQLARGPARPAQESRSNREASNSAAGKRASDDPVSARGAAICTLPETPSWEDASTVESGEVKWSNPLP